MPLLVSLKKSLRRVMYIKEERKLNLVFESVLIFNDFIKECQKGNTYGAFNKSNTRWIMYNAKSAFRKGVSYIVPPPEKQILKHLRQRHNRIINDANSEPLVSVVIPTYNRPDLLLNRALPSVFNQTYRNLEILVIGDNCTDKTESLLREKEKQDSRLKFINLPERGRYPEEPILRWLVAGVAPVNEGLRQSRGLFIAHLDDDDEFATDHIEKAVTCSIEHNLEMVYGKMAMENQDGSWMEVGDPVLRLGGICRSAGLYRGYLKCFEYNINSWKIKEPADFNLWRRMQKSGVRIGFRNAIVGRHYKERTQLGR